MILNITNRYTTVSSFGINYMFFYANLYSFVKNGLIHGLNERQRRE